MAAPPRLELFYGGRYFKGDSIRLCLVYAGLPFEDVRSEDPGWAEFERLREERGARANSTGVPGGPPSRTPYWTRSK